MSGGRKFEDNEKVFARWPGSEKYYVGKILRYSGSGKYDVEFVDDKTISTILTRDIAKESEGKNPRRTRSRSRSRSSSPSRRKKSRSPSRKNLHSPSTSPSSQNGKSPAKSSQKSAPSPTRSPARSARAKKIGEDSVSQIVSPMVKLERVASEKSVLENSKKLSIESKITKVEEVKSSDQFQVASSTMTRRTTRSITRSLKSEESKLSEKEEKPSSCCDIKSKLCCAAGCFKSFLVNTSYIMLTILLLFALYLNCRSTKNCTLFKLPVLPTSLEKYLKWKSFGYVFCWFIFQLGLQSLPLGKQVFGPTLNTGQSLKHLLNGLPALIITMVTVGVLHYFGKFPFKYVVTHSISLMTAAFAFTFLISIVTLILSRKAGPKEPSGGLYKDFVTGRIVSPRICPYVDLKMFALNTGFISWALLNIAYLWKQNQASTIKTNPSMLILQIFQLWYVLDGLFFEETFLYTATITSNKFGFLAYAAMLVWFPFFCAFQARYLAFFPASFRWYYYVFLGVLYVIGYYIYRTSILQKFLFRKDLALAKKSGVRFIPTKNGKNLLVDGWWAKLRHPNYTGDLMMNIAWSCLCGFESVVPWLWTLILVLSLVWMTIEDNARCAKKYGPSWEEYKERVKYKFIPFVY